MHKKQDKSLEKAKAYCLRLISLRPRTEYEIKLRLEQNGYGKSLSESVLNFLKTKKLLDDAQFAVDWIDSRLRLNPRASKIIRKELEDKGVAGSIIEKVFFNKAEELNDKVIAARLAENKLRFEKIPSGMKLKSKIFRFLLNKGFDAELAEEIVGAALARVRTQVRKMGSG